MTDEVVDAHVEKNGNGNGTHDKPKLKLLSAADILGADDVQTVDVDVPEWGGTIRLRSMYAGEMTEFVDNTGKDKAESTIRMLMLCAIDEKGDRLFPDMSMLQRLKAKNLKAFIRVQAIALRLNGLDDESQAEMVKVRKND